MDAKLQWLIEPLHAIYVFAFISCHDKPFPWLTKKGGGNFRYWQNKAVFHLLKITLLDQLSQLMRIHCLCSTTIQVTKFLTDGQI